MSEDNVINMVPEQQQEQKDPMIEIKASVEELTKGADGVIFFAFKNEEAEMNGNKLTVPKTMVKTQYGCVAGGAISFQFAKAKIQKILDELHRQEDEQRAQLSE